MTQDKAVKLAFLVSATDSMSKTLEAASKNLTKFQKTLAEKGAVALSPVFTCGARLSSALKNAKGRKKVHTIGNSL
jgi:PBP1b-binding outer membrane lipoprotein LpoB